MKKNIHLLLFVSITICSQNIYSKDNPSEVISTKNDFLLDELIQETQKEKVIQNFNKTVKELSTKLDYMLKQIENKKDKRAVVKLIQYIQNGQGITEWQNNQDDNNSNNKKNNNSSSIGKEVVKVIKRLTSSTAIVAYATVICFMVTKNIFFSGEITNILNALKNVLEQVAFIEKWHVIGNYAGYALKAIAGYLTLGYVKPW